MRIDSTAGVAAGKRALAVTVRISPWVNEPLPDLQRILCSRDLARLTRRPRWILHGLALIGRFPHQRRFHGRLVGWCRAEVLEWLTNGLRVANDERFQRPPPKCGARLRRNPGQACLFQECEPKWCPRQGLNPRPSLYKSAALPAELQGHSVRGTCSTECNKNPRTPSRR